jgi:hypothetical protein
MNDGKNILRRFMNTFGYKTQKALAVDLGISPSDLNNRAKSGTIKNFLVDYCLQRGLGIDQWLIADKEDAGVSQKRTYPTCEGLSSEVREGCMKLQEILESGDEVARNAILNSLELCWRSMDKKEKRPRQKKV